MKTKIAIMISLIATAANAGDVYRWGSTSTGYDYNTYADVNHSRQQLQLDNYNTGSFNTVDLKPKYGGGYTGWDIDMNTGRMYEVDVDSRGNVDIWNY